MNIDEDHLWNWDPETRNPVQNLQQLLAAGYEQVTGTVRCVYCNSQQHLQFPLAAGFARLRALLQEQRENVLHTLRNNTGLPTYTEIADASTGKLRCGGCGRRGVEPVKPDFEPQSDETELDFELRKMEATNILFLLLGGYLRFLKPKEVKALWIGLNLRPQGIPKSMTPPGMNQRQAYLIALHYYLAKLLEPQNAHLDIGPWPWYREW